MPHARLRLVTHSVHHNTSSHSLPSSEYSSSLNQAHPSSDDSSSRSLPSPDDNSSQLSPWADDISSESLSRPEIITSSPSLIRPEDNPSQLLLSPDNDSFQSLPSPDDTSSESLSSPDSGSFQSLPSLDDDPPQYPPSPDNDSFQSLPEDPSSQSLPWPDSILTQYLLWPHNAPSQPLPSPDNSSFQSLSSTNNVSSQYLSSPDAASYLSYLSTSDTSSQYLPLPGNTSSQNLTLPNSPRLRLHADRTPPDTARSGQNSTAPLRLETRHLFLTNSTARVRNNMALPSARRSIHSDSEHSGASTAYTEKMASSRTFNFPSPLNSLEFSPSGEYLCVASMSEARIWKLHANPFDCVSIRGFVADEGPLYSTFSQDGLRMWVASMTGTVTCLSTLPVERETLVKQTGYTISGIKASPDGIYLAVGVKSAVILLDAVTGTKAATLYAAEISDDICSLMFAADGDRLTGVSRRGVMVIWDVKTRQVVAGPFTQPTSTLHIAYSQNGKFVASAGHDTVVTVWRINKGEEAEITLAAAREACRYTLPIKSPTSPIRSANVSIDSFLERSAVPCKRRHMSQQHTIENDLHPARKRERGPSRDTRRFKAPKKIANRTFHAVTFNGKRLSAPVQSPREVSVDGVELSGALRLTPPKVTSPTVPTEGEPSDAATRDGLLGAPGIAKLPRAVINNPLSNLQIESETSDAPHEYPPPQPSVHQRCRTRVFLNTRIRIQDTIILATSKWVRKRVTRRMPGMNAANTRGTNLAIPQHSSSMDCGQVDGPVDIPVDSPTVDYEWVPERSRWGRILERVCL
ncbi:hypothetical protein CONPUDRAFT_164414 [Coniophora puteana RWD-64-598 SS2]|uniref:Uncharacterized protein n=1 Tax=Coniophora puteana (strain RWD-64-598) TaxID=741705 RepID=A0A5M3MXH4_CONPW|nr:uncharacterized protein CONPUDRAFT_164414 [Coniophora puteana RWD-64-598 SS2]EIW83474.1 hypothetical protein CONPUDRAFT_164414 [Coniophora puteana RWD-64-598 SS2]